MKKIFLIILGIVLIAGAGYCAEDRNHDAAAAGETKAQLVKCPETTMPRDCLTCHVAGKMPGAGKRFPVKEAPPDADRVYPNGSMKVVGGAGHYVLDDINSNNIKEFFDYLSLHKISRAVIEVHSPGGALFDAQRIVSLIQAWQARGGIVEMRLYGMAFSAGFYIFIAGDNRLVSPSSDLMWHEIQSFEGFGFKISTPSDKEEAARILRHLQDVRHNYLATRGKLTKEEIDRKVSKKEWWMSGAEAVAYGFADGFIK